MSLNDLARSTKRWFRRRDRQVTRWARELDRKARERLSIRRTKGTKR